MLLQDSVIYQWNQQKITSNGKIVLTEELDNAIIKNLKVCSAKKIFLEDMEDENTEFDDVRYNVHVPGVE